MDKPLVLEFHSSNSCRRIYSSINSVNLKQNMKKVILGASVCMLMLVGCAKEQAAQEKQETTTTSEAVVEEKVAETSIEVTSILTGYLAIKDALVATNATKASAVAEQLLPMLSSDDETMSLLKESTQTIAGSTDAEAQRAAFEMLSENIYKYVKENELERETLYRQYCPMAFNNKGAYWLSTSNEIRNPYFGDKMLKCGSVRETLD